MLEKLEQLNMIKHAFETIKHKVSVSYKTNFIS